ncbi:substrate-binding domain-containing protein [Gilvibacter sediminis]|uniref:substrate-binding domain-containing protein n=1 Tax=Gilvibacter sediminis TaxID=379071 RepID=UPI00234FC933|nr:substrate-binding domain-containing protein [Gilvibacter sediminis]MDC7998345.1 substrate-binding domain-containing protein [Gilvibacter sediminis]
MTNLKIGGVPEHFNLPWYLTLREKAYHPEGINLRWQDFPGGTGAMCKALRDGSIDMAVILTEGIIADIVKGNPSKIVQVFVSSPLRWGIHVAADSDYQTVDDLKGTKAAISRFGSGSHLMAYVHAQQEGWDLDTDLDFELVKNLNGALEKLPQGIGDYFMWEKFTTKPYVDSGLFRIVGECPTPWPCFVIAVREELLENQPELVRAILEIINTTTYEFKQIPAIDRMLANRYDQKLEDIQLWLSQTQWSQQNLTSKQVAQVQDQLLKLDLIEEKIETDNILFDLNYTFTVD